MRRFTNLLHSLLCEKSHMANMENMRELIKDEKFCMYYLEQTFDQTWQMRDHKQWSTMAEQFMLEFEITDSGEAFKILTSAVDILRGAAPHIEKHPKIKSLLIKLIEVM